jgi:hypothetical protein
MKLPQKSALIFTFLVLLAFAGSAQSKKVIYTKQFIATGSCTYTIYRHKTKKSPTCSDYEFVGVVYKKHPIEVTVKKGEAYTYYVIFGEKNPCGEFKTGFHIKVDPSETESRWSRERLDDETCN